MENNLIIAEEENTKEYNEKQLNQEELKIVNASMRASIKSKAKVKATIISPQVVTPEPDIKSRKYRAPGHLIDQKLKYNYPKTGGSQIGIFDALQENTKDKIKNYTASIEEVAEGIQLTTAQSKIIDCLSKMLHNKSQIKEPGKDTFYTGNTENTELVIYGGREVIAPGLAFTLYELTKEYKGGEKFGGNDIQIVKEVLNELSIKKFLISYTETTPTQTGGRLENKIEEFSPLLRIIKLSQTEYSKEDIELSKKEETVITLNPIFKSQIDTKFILYPEDINKKTIIAYGNHNLSEPVIKLRDYLMRALSSKDYTHTIRLDKLYYQLNEKQMRESRKKLVKIATERAIETMINLGLLEKYTVKPGKTGELQVTFFLNKNF